MAFFRPRVSREAEVRFHADQEVGKTYAQRLERARIADERYRRLEADGLPRPEVREAAIELDQALTDALRAAESAQRSTFGVKSYDDRGRAAADAARDASVDRDPAQDGLLIDSVCVRPRTRRGGASGLPS
jgi:hypothetical protein